MVLFNARINLEYYRTCCNIVELERLLMTNKQFKSALKAVQYIVQQTGQTPWALEKTTGISRQQIDRWMKNETKDIRKPTLDKLAQSLGYEITQSINGIAVSPHTNKQESGDLNMEQSKLLIQYQQREIEQLKDKINQHDSVYDGIQSDIVFAFEIKFNWSLKKPGVKVKYLSQDSDYVSAMAHKLGYTELEMSKLLQVDEMVDYREHNIHQLRTEEQKDEMLSIMDVFMKAYNSIKVNTTMLVAEIPVLYTHKNGTVYKSNVEYRINWVKGAGTAHIRWLKD